MHQRCWMHADVATGRREQWVRQWYVFLDKERVDRRYCDAYARHEHIDNAASYTLSPGQSVMVWSDSTNYLVAPGKSVSSGGSGGATVGGTNGQIQYKQCRIAGWSVLLMRQTASLHLTAPGS